MRAFEVRAAFEKLFKRLDVIDAKVSAMPVVQVQVSERFLPTIIALSKLGRPALAGEVAAVTGCKRTHESMVLNELVGRGIATKETRGRKHYFSLKVKLENEGQTVDC
ncbi:MAG: hypothetical protein NWE95_00615 [Candidatus Bathyarchaeota archaeon]|nr:hypothetical protein [Candidatus Bathyarchaeota archaeon]